jgi:hypothetical protein
MISSSAHVIKRSSSCFRITVQVGTPSRGRIWFDSIPFPFPCPSDEKGLTVELASQTDADPSSDRIESDFDS